MLLRCQDGIDTGLKTILSGLSPCGTTPADKPADKPADIAATPTPGNSVSASEN